MNGLTDERADAVATGQRRYLTLLFSDLSDSTHLGALMEAEHYAEMLAAFRDLCRSIIPRHGGRIARIQGDGVLAIFGLPEAGEDDGRRAAEAALDLHEAVRRLSLRDGAEGAVAAGSLDLHSGIHAGLVFLSDGDVERGRFEVLGNVPNTAFRLSSLAERGDIVVSEETLGQDASHFMLAEREVLAIRGRSQTVAAFRVLGRAPAASRSQARAQRGQAPLVGRDAELRALRHHLRMAVAGVPQCVALAGGPGLGKSRLLDAVAEEAAAAGCQVLRGYCEAYQRSEPLQPFLQVLRALAGRQDGAAAVAERTLAGAAVPAAAALAPLFAALAERQPLLLLLDDWQWADDASQQVLDAVRALDSAIFVLLASRGGTESVLPGAVKTLGVEPLTLEAAERTIRALLPGADPFVVADIHHHAGGNPLFIEELCHAAASDAGARAPERRPGSAAWLNALIESRVARLPAAQAAVVRAAAVIGNVFPAWLLQRITGLADDDPLLLALAEQDLIFPAEQPGPDRLLRFKHGITRDVVYEAVGLHERRALHRRIAAVLGQAQAQAAPEQPEALEALAYHCAAGGMPAEAAVYAERAGDKAMAASALDHARVQYSAALSALDGSADTVAADRVRWCTVVQKLALACVFDPLALADGVALFERGVALARQSGDLDLLARAEYWLGYIGYAKGMARQAVLHCEASLDLAARLGNARLVTQVRATLGQVLMSTCDYERSLALLDEAIESKRRHAKVGNSVAVGSAYSLACKATVLADRGRFGDADRFFDEALALLGDTDHQVASSVRHWLSVVRQWQGRWEEARQASEAASRIAERVKSRQQLAMARAIGGYAEWILNHRPEALQVVQEATSWISARNGALATSLNQGWLIDGAVALGRHDEARHHAALLFRRARDHDLLGMAMGCRALAAAAAHEHDSARAEHYLRLADRAAARRGSPHEQAANQLQRARLALQGGELAAARRWLDEACGGFTSMAMHWHLRQAEELRRGL